MAMNKRPSKRGRPAKRDRRPGKGTRRRPSQRPQPMAVEAMPAPPPQPPAPPPPATAGGERTRENGAAAGARLQATPNAFPIVGIGASAGGLEALEQFLRHTPERS